jgi:hypothetical protein
MAPKTGEKVGDDSPSVRGRDPWWTRKRDLDDPEAARD